MNIFAAIDFCQNKLSDTKYKILTTYRHEGRVTCEARNCKRINGQQRLFSLDEFTKGSVQIIKMEI